MASPATNEPVRHHPASSHALLNKLPVLGSNWRYPWMVSEHQIHARTMSGHLKTQPLLQYCTNSKWQETRHSLSISAAKWFCVTFRFLGHIYINTNTYLYPLNTNELFRSKSPSHIEGGLTFSFPSQFVLSVQASAPFSLTRGNWDILGRFFLETPTAFKFRFIFWYWKTGSRCLQPQKLPSFLLTWRTMLCVNGVQQARR